MSFEEIFVVNQKGEATQKNVYPSPESPLFPDGILYKSVIHDFPEEKEGVKYFTVRWEYHMKIKKKTA
jgi:hypothetical protein